MMTTPSGPYRSHSHVHAIEETELISAQLDHGVLLVTILVNSMFQEATMLEFDSQVRRHLKHDGLSLVLDCSRLTHVVSSQFLGILIKLQKAVRARGGHMSLCGVTGNLREVLEVTRLDRVFAIHQTGREAIAQNGEFSAWEKVGFECVRHSEASKDAATEYFVTLTPFSVMAGIAATFLLGITLGCLINHVGGSSSPTVRKIPSTSNSSAVLKHNPEARKSAP